MLFPAFFAFTLGPSITIRWRGVASVSLSHLHRIAAQYVVALPPVGWDNLVVVRHVFAPPVRETALRGPDPSRRGFASRHATSATLLSAALLIFSTGRSAFLVPLYGGAWKLGARICELERLRVPSPGTPHPLRGCFDQPQRVRITLAPCALVPVVNLPRVLNFPDRGNQLGVNIPVVNWFRSGDNLRCSHFPPPF
jgi:membrane-associated phospholipid phosphatase